MAVEEAGHSAADVAKVLGVKRVSAHHSVKKGKKVFESLSTQL